MFTSPEFVINYEFDRNFVQVVEVGLLLYLKLSLYHAYFFSFTIFELTQNLCMLDY